MLPFILLAFGFPILFLGMAWSAARAGRLRRAESLATAAGTWSWMLLGVGGLVALSVHAMGFPLWRYPEAAAALSAPVAIWWYARSLYASIRARREAEAAPAPPPADPAR
jgi:hypothetical protein